MTKTILCADDSATMQTVAQITFNAGDYEYVGAKSADEALEKAKAQKPDLILADALMPGKTGYELCRAVKSDPGLADVPVLMLCGNSEAFDPEKGKQAGADGHVTKPWDTQQMLDKVTAVFEQVKAEGVAKPGAAAAAAAAPAAAEKAPPKRAPTPPPTPAAAKPAQPPKTPPAVTPPKGPASPEKPAAASRPAPPRSATLMGMPTFKMPPGGKEKPAGVTSITPPSEEKKAPEAVKPAAEAKPAPAPKPVPEPVAASAPKPAAAPKPAPEPKPAPAAKPAPEPDLAPAGAPAKPAAAAGGPGRAPMISATPSRRPGLAKANAQRQAVATAATVAREAGLDPKGPEMDLLIKLSSEVVERIVWEVVPELAETIIRENLDKLTAKQP